MIKQDIKVMQNKDALTYVTVNFKFSEIKCHCNYEDCNFTLVSPQVLNSLQRLREIMAVPLTINRFFSCKKHNKDVGSIAVLSKHLLGLAVDISTDEHSENNKEKLIATARILFDTVLIYPTFIHCHDEKSRNYI